jgi:uncharacterized protein YbjT (DUF2867 family)
MATPTLIAVTGSTGSLGGRVATRLAAAGVRQRLVVRDPARAPDLPDVEIAQATYDDADALRDAFAGTDAVFLVSAAEHPDRVRQHLTAVDAVAAAGVDRVVYTSFLNASPDATFTLARHHWATEERLREHDLAYTALRDSMYLDFLPFMAGAEGVVRGPAGNGRVAMVARDDIADVAVAVLLGDGHERATYDITGGALHTVAEYAAELSEVTGREVSFVDETIEEARASRAHYGAPDWLVEAWISTYTAIRDGELEDVSDDIERLLGRPATTFADAVRAAARR